MQPEYDLIWMTLLVFIPSVFALGLIFFPKGAERAMCWWSLAGTAVTLGISIAMFIGFKNNVIDAAGATGDASERALMSLDYRTLTRARAEGTSTEFSSSDWVSRYPWIRRF